ncbi:MAG TPA: molecular chaperone DnaJ [Elusimicrobia bacterium]|nr:molecular chaperone DnaJ [Elusimicrobiota bacterium]
MSTDYYRLLGVARNAGQDEIKSAYRHLALKHHPDRNPGNKDSEGIFKEINEAYTVLSDVEKRRIYDQFGAEGLKAGRGGAGGFGGFQNAEFGDIFGDIFDNFFGEQGGRSRGPRQRRGADLKYGTEISLEEAFSGVKVPVNFDRTEICEVCGGTGAKPKTGLKKCATCRGAGRVQYAQGFFSFSQTCPDCGGQGEVVSSPCRDCGGSGRKKKAASLNVKIPPGVEEGAVLRVSGAGDAGMRDGASGDLYIQVTIKHNTHFTRQDSDLIYECQVSVAQAVLGAEVEVPVIEGGRVKLRLPQGTQHGKVLRVHERGMPSSGGLKKRGDLLVRVKIEIPHELTPKQRELFEALAVAFGETPLPHCEEEKGFFKKILG